MITSTPIIIIKIHGVNYLEKLSDKWQAKLQPLENFIRHQFPDAYYVRVKIYKTKPNTMRIQWYNRLVHGDIYYHTHTFTEPVIKP